MMSNLTLKQYLLHGKNGFAKLSLDEESDNMKPLFDTIVNTIEEPSGSEEESLQLLVSNIDYDNFTGRIGIGKIDNGSLKVNQEAVVVNAHEEGKCEKVRITKLYEFDGLGKVDVNEASVGAIVAISGIADIHIGDRKSVV